MNKRIGFGLYQSSQNKGNVGCVFVFGLRWCRWRVGRGLDQSLEGWVVLCLCESGFSVYMASAIICILCLSDTCVS